MNAGQLERAVRHFDESLTRRVTVTFFLLSVGSLIVFFQLFNEKMLSVIFFGTLLIFAGLIEVGTLRRGSKYRRTLKEYRRKWLQIRWTHENLVKKIGLLVPDNPDMARYAEILVSENGVGPYPPQVLFSVIHSAKMYEAERSLTLGMIDLMGNNHLVRGVVGYIWSEKIQERFLELNPVYREFDPNDSRTHSYGVFHHGNRD